jgi:hypothetical protein
LITEVCRVLQPGRSGRPGAKAKSPSRKANSRGAKADKSGSDR